MPHQNRVTPFSILIADPARGDVMGNRGCLHNDQKHILHHHADTCWIICKLEFPHVPPRPPRPIMAPGMYTELFFLDEATAFAAGHRPCTLCNRERFTAFQHHWAAANPTVAGGATPRVTVLDAHLHRERCTEAYYARDQRKCVYLDVLDAVPEGAFVALGDGLDPHLVHATGLLPWTPGGYKAPVARPTGQMVVVLTPRSVVRAISNGFRLVVHASASNAATSRTPASDGTATRDAPNA